MIYSGGPGPGRPQNDAQGVAIRGRRCDDVNAWTYLALAVGVLVLLNVLLVVLVAIMNFRRNSDEPGNH